MVCICFQLSFYYDYVINCTKVIWHSVEKYKSHMGVLELINGVLAQMYPLGT